MPQTALLTGITGQDGSYLVELLLSKGYAVHGIIRRASTFNTARIDHVYADPHDPDTKLFLHYGDLTDSGQLTNLIYNTQPQEVYHLGAQSHVRVSFDTPEYTGDVTGLGTTRILEAIKRSGVSCKFYQASSSEMFGNAPPPQSEDTAFYPRSPYGAAKAYAYWMTVNYREGTNLFACNGILFNHESPRRGETFVTRKISRAVAHIMAGKQKDLYMGNLEAKRDWGFAPEYVEGMHDMLQMETPRDYVLGTGETHTVRDFVEEAFGYVGLDWRDFVKEDPQYLRPTEVDVLVANPQKANSLLKWQPRITFKDLVRIMVDADIRKLGMEPKGEGDAILRQKFPHKWWKGD
ncbi:MAG TPA: GDP-mannose 4,6-dehydratase [Nitrospirales bacterium]|nr:GDP-mannose 4,6-dehydratase [Nitrospiraceae bacterium]HNP27966.1 GDP-mannose 4,6-dehydratase [Nitrospirales bacterium]